jgi:cardiolipin hydrolase
MHHKFAVVDGRRLITGSLNWTLTAIQSNKENILVTEEPDLVLPFITEFQRLWDVNDPARRHLLSIAEKPASLVL